MSTARNRSRIPLLPLIAILTAATAHAQWSSNPAANLAIADVNGDQAVPRIAASGDGSTWMAWFDNRSGSYAVYVQHVNALGVETFPHLGLLVSANPQSTSLIGWDMISDGAGGCVLAFTDTRSGPDLDVYAYRIDVAGNFLWGPNGVTLSSNADGEGNPSCARTSDGSFVIAWTRGPATGPGAVHMQKLDPAGAPQFAGDGLQIVAPASERPLFATVVDGGGGGWIVSYVRDTATFQSPRHIRTQKFDATGAALWNGGTPLPVYDFNSIPIAHQPLLVPDGAGGAVHAWHRAAGSDFEVLVQRIDASGAEMWAHNGVSASTDATIELDPAIAFLPASGDTIVVFDKRNAAQSMWSLSAQRISAAGSRLWTDPALDLMPLDATVKSIIRAVPYGDGALAFCFWQSNMASLDSQVLAFRLDGSGASTWLPSPLPASSVASSKLRLAACADGSGIARLMWGDNRNGGGADIFAQNVDCDGTLGNGSPSGTSTYCVAAPNSVGPGAHIGSSGSTVIALNNLTLTCNGLPPGTNGLWFYGPNAAQVPFGNGFRCVTGTVFRLGPPQTSSAGGTVARALDLTVPPASSGPGAILAASTWRFQLWYRNPAAGGAGFNLSDGLEAVFCP
jgi:hypothetical protein